MAQQRRIAGEGHMLDQTVLRHQAQHLAIRRHEGHACGDRLPRCGEDLALVHHHATGVARSRPEQCTRELVPPGSDEACDAEHLALVDRQRHAAKGRPDESVSLEDRPSTVVDPSKPLRSTTDSPPNDQLHQCIRG